MHTTFRFALWEVALCIVAIGGVACFVVERIDQWPSRAEKGQAGTGAATSGNYTADVRSMPHLFVPDERANPLHSNELGSRHAIPDAAVQPAGHWVAATAALAAGMLGVDPGQLRHDR